MALAGISCVQRTGCFELVTQVCGVPTDSRKQYIYPLYAIPIAIQNIWRCLHVTIMGRYYDSSELKHNVHTHD